MGDMDSYIFALDSQDAAEQICEAEKYQSRLVYRLWHVPSLARRLSLSLIAPTNSLAKRRRATKRFQVAYVLWPFTKCK